MSRTKHPKSGADQVALENKHARLMRTDSHDGWVYCACEVASKIRRLNDARLATTPAPARSLQSRYEELRRLAEAVIHSDDIPDNARRPDGTLHPLTPFWRAYHALREHLTEET